MMANRGRVLISFLLADQLDMLCKRYAITGDLPSRVPIT